MQISVKAYEKVFKVSVEKTTTFATLKSRIAAEIGESNFQLLLGQERFNFSENATISDMDLVSGDRLFVTFPENPSEKCDCLEPSSTISKLDNQSEFNTSLEHNIKYYEENIISFKNRIVRTLQDFMVDSGYSNNCLQSWNSPVSIGVELQFEKLSRGNLPNISILVTILIYPSPSAVINVSKIIDNSRHFLPSFSIYQSNINDSVVNGMGKALTSSGNVTLSQLLAIRSIRDVLLVWISPATFAYLSATNRLNNFILSSPTVDRSYWKECLKRDFGPEKVSLGQSAGRLFKTVYVEEYVKAQRKEREIRTAGPSGIFINGPFPYSPGTYPQPTSPFSSPFQPIPNPFRPLSPTYPLNPFHPSRELLPSRPERPSGPRIFPPNRWDDNII